MLRPDQCKIYDFDNIAPNARTSKPGYEVVAGILYSYCLGAVVLPLLSEEKPLEIRSMTVANLVELLFDIF